MHLPSASPGRAPAPEARGACADQSGHALWCSLHQWSHDLRLLTFCPPGPELRANEMRTSAASSGRARNASTHVRRASSSHAYGVEDAPRAPLPCNVRDPKACIPSARAGRITDGVGQRGACAAHAAPRTPAWAPAQAARPPLSMWSNANISDQALRLDHGTGRSYPSLSPELGEDGGTLVGEGAL